MRKNSLGWKVDEAKKVIVAALEKWDGSIGAAFTGRKDSTVMMHMILSVAKSPPPVMFIDHGMHFPESLKHFNKMVKKWHLVVRGDVDTKLMKMMKAEKDQAKKQELIQQIKIKAIADTIKNNKWKALFVAIRKDENEARKNEEYFSKRDGHVRVHPMLHFTEKDVWEYIKVNRIPHNPLYDEGYRSIGEQGFTRPTKKGESERAGRDQNKEQVMERLRALGYF